MTDLFDSRTVPLHVQIEAVEREIAFRIRVYGRRVTEGKMTQAKSAHETGAMRAVLATLQELQASALGVGGRR